MTDIRRATLPQIVLVRHGATEWSENGRHTGRTDVPLTKAGETQAAALAPLIPDLPYTEVRSSPSGRARETARLAGFWFALRRRSRFGRVGLWRLRRPHHPRHHAAPSALVAVP